MREQEESETGDVKSKHYEDGDDSWWGNPDPFEDIGI
jgi:hypothetical protein